MDCQVALWQNFCVKVYPKLIRNGASKKILIILILDLKVYFKITFNNEYRIFERFSYTLIKCFSQLSLTIIMPPTPSYNFTPSPPMFYIHLTSFMNIKTKSFTKIARAAFDGKWIILRCYLAIDIASKPIRTGSQLY